MGKFSEDIMRFRLKVEEQATQRFRKVVLDLDRAVIMGGVGAAPGTPVDTGRARGNWYANIGPEPQAAETDNTDPEGGATLGAAESVVLNAKLGDTVWLSNALPYIRVLEYGLYPLSPKGGQGKTEAGFSNQAVGGMVSQAVAEFASIVEEVPNE